MKKNKGFTLIELLAVLVLLAVIALTTGPIFIKSIDTSRKNAFKNTAEGIIRTIKTNSNENNYEAETFTIKNGEILKSGGETVTSNASSKVNGTASIDMDGKVKVAVNNGEWCARTDSKYTVLVENYNASTCK